MFDHGDGVMLYSVLRHFKPSTVVEVGSGFSSALMLDVNEKWLDQSMDLTFIEPYPDRLNSILKPGDRSTATIIERPVQDVDLEVFSNLESGNVLFIDSSHVCKAGSDLHRLIFEVLPALKPGVIVHFHDIHWPFELPRVWADMGRAWNEVHILKAYLSFNPNFEILLFNNWLAWGHAERVKALLPEWSDESAGSLWLRRIGE
jgi:predicted O-methyltransferase YrrM